MPSVGITGLPLPGQGDSATWSGSQNGPGVAGGMQYGATNPRMGGNVNYVSARSGIPAGLGMPPLYTDDMNMPSGGMDTVVGGSNITAGNSGFGTLNIASTAGANVAGSGFGLPEDHNPLSGGVPVLPDVSKFLLLLRVFFNFS